MSPQASAIMREAMVGVVEGGSGRNGQIAGFVVGGKTGTAQLGTDPPSSHAWFIAFAGPPGEAPEVAVAVLVEAQPGVSEVTGGRVAAPIARAVMEAVLNLPD
jgi:peptidoglycan glycosyltransferase